MSRNELEIRLVARDEVTKAVQRMQGNVTKSTNKMKGSFTDLAVKVLAFQRAIQMAGRAVGTFVAAASKVEQFSLRLEQMLGSVEESNRLFADMQHLVATTPFMFDEVMESVTNLSAVTKNGAQEIKDLMPIIMDLSASFGIGIRETTSQFIRMMSAGAASADMFRERGILSALGFQAGVSVSADETIAHIKAQWEDGTNRMVGSVDKLRDSWVGRTAEMQDAWFNFKVAFGSFIIESDLVKAAITEISTLLATLTEQVKRSKEEGTALTATVWEMTSPLGLISMAWNNIARDIITAQNAAIDFKEPLDDIGVTITTSWTEANEKIDFTIQQLMRMSEVYAEINERSQFQAETQADLEKKFTATATKMEKVFSTNLAGMMSGAKTAKEAFADLGKGMIQVITTLIAEEVIAHTIGKALQKMAVLSSVASATILAQAWQPAALFASVATGGGAAVAGSTALMAANTASMIATSGRLSASLVAATAMAEGGIVTKPTLALIGEAGPEAVVPLSGDRGGGAFGDINITINNPMANSEDVGDLAEELGFEFERILRMGRG